MKSRNKFNWYYLISILSIFFILIQLGTIIRFSSSTALLGAVLIRNKVGNAKPSRGTVMIDLFFPLYKLATYFICIFHNVIAT